MGSITNYLENELLDHVFNAAYTPASTIYLALATADPTDSATGASMNEVANTGAYARKAITFGAASSRAVTQNADVEFDQASGSWGSVSHWAIVDSATYGAGNVLAHGAFGTAKSVVSGNTPSVASGEISVSYTAGEISDYLANALLDLAFRNQAYSAPDTYIGLATATLSDSTTGSTVTEPAAGAYARVQVNVNGGSSPTWNLASSGLVDNAAAITFPEATASWGTIVAAFVVDAATNGNVLFYDNDVTDTAVAANDTVEFASSDFNITMS